MSFANENIIVTVKITEGKVTEEKDMSVPVTAKISEIFPPNSEVRKIVALNKEDSFETAGVLYGDILEVKCTKGE